MIRKVVFCFLASICFQASSECIKNTTMNVLIEKSADFGRNDVPATYGYAAGIAQKIFQGAKMGTEIAALQVFPDSKHVIKYDCPPHVYMGNFVQANKLYGKNFIVLAQDMEDSEIVIATPKLSSFSLLDDVQLGMYLLAVPDSAEEAYVAGPLSETKQVNNKEGARLISISSSLLGLQIITPTKQVGKSAEYGNMFLLGKNKGLPPEKIGVITTKSLVESYNAKLVAEGVSFAQFRMLRHPKFSGPGNAVFVQKGGEQWIHDLVTKNVVTSAPNAILSKAGYTARTELFDIQYGRYMRVQKDIAAARLN